MWFSSQHLKQNNRKGAHASAKATQSPYETTFKNIQI